MSELYPLLLQPHFDERPWGARDLAPIYDRHVEPGQSPIGEAWVAWDECRVVNGPLAGSTLKDLCRHFGRELVGKSAIETDRFPLLLKFLFPRDKLSVQVHPDDEVARRHGEPCGKTECWYVISAEEGSRVALGLKPGVTRAQFEQAIRETSAEELLNWVELTAGDMIYVDAGTVHTLGPGLVIIETQQNSDTTYRLYDYGRGRELHIRDGLEAMKERTAAGKVGRTPQGSYEQLISTECFTVEKYDLETPQFLDSTEYTNEPQVLVAIGGCGVIESEEVQPVAFTRGEAVVIPASLQKFRVRPQWKIEFLKARP